MANKANPRKAKIREEHHATPNLHEILPERPSRRETAKDKVWLRENCLWDLNLLTFLLGARFIVGNQVVLSAWRWFDLEEYRDYEESRKTQDRRNAWFKQGKNGEWVAKNKPVEIRSAGTWVKGLKIQVESREE